MSLYMTAVEGGDAGTAITLPHTGGGAFFIEPKNVLDGDI